MIVSHKFCHQFFLKGKSGFCQVIKREEANIYKVMNFRKESYFFGFSIRNELTWEETKPQLLKLYSFM